MNINLRNYIMYALEFKLKTVEQIRDQILRAFKSDIQKIFSSEETFVFELTKTLDMLYRQKEISRYFIEGKLSYGQKTYTYKVEKLFPICPEVSPNE